ncbi:MAG: hypothetical protein ACKVOW_20895 [Chitinophagaceae bacterium]
MTNSVTSTMLIFITLAFVNCNNHPSLQNDLLNPDSIKQIILTINSQQQSLLKDTSHRSERFAILCEDSLINVFENGNLLISSYASAHDLVDGYADTIHDIRFQLFGNTAVLTGIAKMYEVIYGDSLFENIRITKVFVQNNGKWKMAVRTASPVSVNYFREVTVNSKKLNDYTGIYQWPKNVYDTLRIENGRLVSHIKGGPPVINYALNDSTFFIKNDLTTIVFIKNASGRITHLNWVLTDGQRIRIPKVK